MLRECPRLSRAVVAHRARFGNRLRDAEVRHNGRAAGREQDIFRFDVAVDDARIVRGGEREQYPAQDLDRLAGRQFRVAPEPFTQ